jgi:Bacteriophage related domain of unknown function
MITQIDAKIYEALRARIASMSGGIAVVYPGQIYPASPDVPFILVTDVKFGNDRVYIGSSADDVYTGDFMLDIMTPLSWTHSQVLGVAGNIRAWFTKDLLLGGLVRITKTPAVTVSYRDGGFMRLPVSVSWRAVG